MKRALVVMTVMGAACQLPPSVLYRCGVNDTCRAGEACWSDGYCHPESDGVEDAGGKGGGSATGGGAATGGGTTGGGTATGGGGDVDAGDDAGTTDAGTLDAGLDAGTDAGVDDAGVDAGSCVPLASCPGAVECGFVDAGCGRTLDCGSCAAPEECGTLTPNVCSLPKLCAHGFCWENPLPQGNTLFGTFALGPRAVWAVGELGTVLFWNGERTELIDVGTTVDLRAVHGLSASELYVAGEGSTILRFDGSVWRRETTPGVYRINTLWAAAPGLAFAGATGGYILKRETNGTWSEMAFAPSSTVEILSIVGLATGEVYATSTERLWRLPTLASSTWQGDTIWTNRDSLTLGGLMNQLYAGGKVTGQTYGVLVERQSDAGWVQRGPNVPQAFTSIAVLQPSMPALGTPNGVLVLQSDAGFLSFPFSRDGGLSDITRLDDATAFGVGTMGSMAVVNLNPVGLRELSSGGLVNANAVCGYSDTRLYAPGDDRIVYERRSSSDGARWDAVLRTTPSGNRWLACFADGPDKVWITGNSSNFLRQSGGVFVTSTSLGSQNWTGVWGSTSGPWLFVSEQSQIYSSNDGATASYLTNGATGGPASVWGFGTTSALTAAGPNSHMRIYNGTFWIDLVPPSYGRTLRSVHGQRFADGGATYSIVGLNTAWRRVNGTFVVDAIDAGAGVSANLRSGWMAPEGDIWAAGDDGGVALSRGLVMHFDEDGGWVALQSPTPRALLGVTGVADTGPFIVGEKGVILRKLGADGG